MLSLHPAEFAVLALLFLSTLKGGNTLRVRLRDYGNLAWHADLRPPYRAALLASEQKTMKRTMYLLAAFDATLAVLAIRLLRHPGRTTRSNRSTLLLVC